MPPPSPPRAPSLEGRPYPIGTIAFRIVAVLLFAIAIRGVARSLSPAGSDLTVYLDAADAVRDGRDPLDVEQYIYLPCFAVLTSPLALLPRWLAAVLWQLVSFGCVVWGVRTAARLAHGEDEHGATPPWLAAATLAITFRLWDSNLSYGQVNAFTFALLVGALAAERRGQLSRAGALAGFATALKVLPGIALLFFALRGRWRAVRVGAFVAAVVALGLPVLVQGPSRANVSLGHWLHQVVEPYLAGGERLLAAREYLPGQSLVASLYRLLADTASTSADLGARANLLSLSPERVHWIVRAATALHLALLAWAVARPPRPAPAGSRLWATQAALALCTALLVGPLVHKAHMCWSALGFAVLLTAARERRGARRAVPVAGLVVAGGLVALTTSFLLGTHASRGLLSHNALFFGIEALWWTLLYCTLRSGVK